MSLGLFYLDEHLQLKLQPGEEVDPGLETFDDRNPGSVLGSPDLGAAEEGPGAGRGEPH